jgi:hypothetical protein
MDPYAVICSGMPNCGYLPGFAWHSQNSTEPYLPLTDKFPVWRYDLVIRWKYRLELVCFERMICDDALKG